jgi:hypothetical protein
MLVTTATPYGSSGSSTGDPGTYVIIRPRDLHVWSSQNPDQELLVLLEAEDENLYRNTSSTTLDATCFPFLSSTPFWVQLLYSLLAAFLGGPNVYILRPNGHGYYTYLGQGYLHDARDGRLFEGKE